MINKKMNNRYNFIDIIKSNESPNLRVTTLAVLTLAMPTILEQLMITLVQYVDSAMVGSLGATATAAVGITSTTLWLINGLTGAASIGFSVQVAQHYGAGNIDKMKSIVRQSLSCIVIFGALLGTIGFVLSFFLPTWLGAEEAVKAPAFAYLAIMTLSVPFNLCILMLSSIIRCVGDTRTPMILNLLINVINVSMNFLLIYETSSYNILGINVTIPGAGLGVAGAALGSAISLVVVSVLYLYLLFFKYEKLRVDIKDDFRLKKEAVTTALKLGVPVAIERSTICLAQITMTLLIATMGTVAIAANHLAVIAEAISYLPAFGVATAGTALIGQAMGAGRKDLALKCGRVVYALGVIIMSLGGLFLYFLAEPLIRFFTADEQVILLGSEMLRIVAIAQPFFGLAISISGAFRGAGDTKAPSIISLLTMWGIRVVAAFVLAPTYGLAGVWMAMTIELIIRGLLFLIRYESKKWMQIKVI